MLDSNELNRVEQRKKKDFISMGYLKITYVLTPTAECRHDNDYCSIQQSDRKIKGKRKSVKHFDGNMKTKIISF